MMSYGICRQHEEEDMYFAACFETLRICDSCLVDEALSETCLHVISRVTPLSLSFDRRVSHDTEGISNEAEGRTKRSRIMSCVAEDFSASVAVGDVPGREFFHTVNGYGRPSPDRRPDCGVYGHHAPLDSDAVRLQLP